MGVRGKAHRQAVCVSMNLKCEEAWKPSTMVLVLLSCVRTNNLQNFDIVLDQKMISFVFPFFRFQILFVLKVVLSLLYLSTLKVCKNVCNLTQNLLKVYSIISLVVIQQYFNIFLNKKNMTSILCTRILPEFSLKCIEVAYNSDILYCMYIYVALDTVFVV